MISNNDNNNTLNSNNNNKCNEHTVEDIVGICVQCDNIPVCLKCMMGKGIHNKHDTDEISNEIVEPILKELQTITIPKLNESLKHSKSQLVEYDNQLNHIEAEYTLHTHKIKSIFQQLHNNMTSIERDLIRQLDTTLNENRDIHSIQHSTINSNIELIDILNTSYNNNYQHNNIEILKHNRQCKKLLSKSNNSSSSSSSSYFKQSQLDENISNIDEINNSIKSLFTIKITHSNDEVKQPTLVQLLQELQQIPPNSKEVKWAKMILQLIREGVTLKEGTLCFAADSLSKLSVASFPPTANRLMLLDGFNESLKSIPKSIKLLYIFDIKLQLVPGTIPNHIEQLLFCDGFNQTITKGIIPSSVTHLYLCDIVKPLNDDSIPNTVKTIYKSLTFKHSITSNKTSYNWIDYGKYEYV